MSAGHLVMDFSGGVILMVTSREVHAGACRP